MTLESLKIFARRLCRNRKKNQLGSGHRFSHIRRRSDAFGKIHAGQIRCVAMRIIDLVGKLGAAHREGDIITAVSDDLGEGCAPVAATNHGDSSAWRKRDRPGRRIPLGHFTSPSR